MFSIGPPPVQPGALSTIKSSWAAVLAAHELFVFTSIVNDIQVIFIVAEDGVAVVNSHAAQGVVVALRGPDLAAGLATVIAVAVASTVRSGCSCPGRIYPAW